MKRPVLGALAFAAVLAACSAATDVHPAATPEASPTFHPASVKDPGWEGWHKVMSKVPPPKDGCFRASFPSTTWTEMACGPAPVDYVPSFPSPVRASAKAAATRVETPLLVGDGVDWLAKTTGTFTMATGSFPSVTGGTSSGAYSLQVNTNAFPLPSTNPLCNGSSSCLGQQQGVYSSTGNPDGAFFEYVLQGLSSCPGGWQGNGGNCYKPSNTIPGVPLVSITDLPSLNLFMESGTPSDVLRVTIEGTAYAGSFPAVVNLAGGAWNQTEFGVFGPNNGQELSFDPNTTIVTQLTTEPPTNATTCALGEITLESNNLSLVQNQNCCLAFGGSSPGIEFTQSNVPGEACSVCGGEGQQCCSVGSGWCASSSDVCYGQTCSPCGGNGQPCCAGNACTGSGIVCQLGACGVPNTLVASPAALSLQAGDGTSGVNTGTTNLEASGYWASNDENAPTLTFTATGVPSGVALPAPGAMPTGLSWFISNDINPPTVRVTAATNTAPGVYTFAVTGTIGEFQATAQLTVTVGACQPMTCAAADWVCGSFDNGCGQTATCGTCPSGESCSGGACYKTCAPIHCAAPEFFNPTTCKCQSCPCGTIDLDGKLICNVCKPGAGPTPPAL